MSRRNLLVILVALFVSAACVVRADHNPYGRYLSQVLDAIDRWALRRVPPHDLFDGAMNGIVGQLDEYSTYISSRELPLFEANIEQQFGGIGVTVKLEGEPKRLTVVSPPLFGTPAVKAGILVRDQILKIDGVATVGLAMDRVIRLMRGPSGAAVLLTVLHEGARQAVTMEIVRETIQIPSVLGDVHRRDGSWDYRVRRDPRVGLVRITHFGEKTAAELEAALRSLRRTSVQALIIDLRDNAGGLLPAAVETCDLFLPKDRVIVSIRGRHPGLEDVQESSGQGVFLETPLVVLVNHYSASASEIVAACLQDHKRAAVVGQRTWGKGTVQHVIPIESGRSLLKLTAATYWRPSGKNIHRLQDDPDAAWGVTPDPGLQVPLTEAEWAAIRAERNRLDGLVSPADRAVERADEAVDDPQLERALAYLESTTKATPSP